MRGRRQQIDVQRLRSQNSICLYLSYASVVFVAKMQALCTIPSPLPSIFSSSVFSPFRNPWTLWVAGPVSSTTSTGTMQMQGRQLR